MLTDKHLLLGEKHCTFTVKAALQRTSSSNPVKKFDTASGAASRYSPSIGKRLTLRPGSAIGTEKLVRAEKPPCLGRWLEERIRLTMRGCIILYSCRPLRFFPEPRAHRGRFSPHPRRPGASHLHGDEITAFYPHRFVKIQKGSKSEFFLCPFLSFSS